VNAEGVGAAISPEFLQATASGFLMLVIAWWLWLGQAALWRGWLWKAGVRSTVDALGAQVKPRGGGFHLVAGDAGVEFGSGLWGPWTTVTVGKARESRDGVLDPAETVALIAELRARAAPPASPAVT
jgi:hypothetical protein